MMIRSAPARLAAFAAAGLLLSVIAQGQDGPGLQPKPAHPGPDMPLEKQEAIIHAAEPSTVIVEYTLQYDKGEPPQGGRAFDNEDGEDLIREERPLRQIGLLIDAKRIVTEDIQLHPRFIKAVRVRAFSPDGKAQQAVGATISAYAKEQRAVFMDLSDALPGVKPAVFDIKQPGPYFIVQTGEEDGRWVSRLGHFDDDILMVGGKSIIKEHPGLIVDSQGVGVGVSTGTDLAAANWKAAPADWPQTTAADTQKQLSAIETQSARGIVRVTLNFRSPRNAAGAEPHFSPDGDENATVQHVLGVITDEHSILVLSAIRPAVTARLERIKVFTDPPVDAKFKASLQDYGAFVAETDKAMSGVMIFSKAPILDLSDVELPSADIYMQGEKRVAYIQPRRIDAFATGWHGNVYPQVHADTKGLFLFDADGQLLSLPLAQRDKVGANDPGNYRPHDDRLTPVAHLVNVLVNLKENSDPNNVPLSEDQENRLAWVGFELQGMTQELARANNVSDQTKDGETGGIVTFVYPESPAAKAGVEPGWVLLRVDVEGQPKPIEVHVESEPYGGQPFPWDELGSAPEAVFDRIPTPWPGVETPLIRTLTDLGFGKKFIAEFWHDGKIEKKDFTVVQGPPSYESAPKYKFDPLGVTVRDMTFEVRRYMQKKDDDPGVIISKIELGSRASVSGLKPYEVITHVNDQPVANVKDFERLAKGQTELRLTVKRMSNGRIVKVNLAEAPASPQKSPEPDGGPAALPPPGQ